MDVPSLYVRVYHVRGSMKQIAMSSLTVCEGISFDATSEDAAALFPYYT